MGSMGETGTEDAGKEDGWLARGLRAEIPPTLLRGLLAPVIVGVGPVCGVFIGVMTLTGIGYPATMVARMFTNEETATVWGMATGAIAAAVTGLWTWVGLVVLFTAPKYKRIVNAVFCAAVAGCILVAVWTNPAPKPGTGSETGLLPAFAALLVVALVFVGMNAWLRHAARKGLPSPLTLLVPKTARMKEEPPVPGGEPGEDAP